MVQKTPAVAVSPRFADLIEVALTRHSAVRQGSPTFKKNLRKNYGPLFQTCAPGSTEITPLSPRRKDQNEQLPSQTPHPCPLLTERHWY
jgi:hypothetical protein